MRGTAAASAVSHQQATAIPGRLVIKNQLLTAIVIGRQLMQIFGTTRSIEEAVQKGPFNETVVETEVRMG